MTDTRQATPSRANAAATKTGPLSATVVAVAFIAALTAARTAALPFVVVGLGPEEAQYWSWAQHLAFGYFSKPPMIAWLIAGTTAVCGDGEACVRLAAPLLIGGAALLMFFLAKRLYDGRTGAWAAIAFATLPGVWLSAGLITTDAPLIFFWALALFAYDRLVASAADRSKALFWAALTGAAVGLGFLSKYAMVYVLLCAAIHAAASRDARRVLLSPAGAVLAGVAALIVLPNILWNLQEGFATLRHTAANANWQGSLFHPKKLIEFIGSQFGLFGPILMIMFLWGLLTIRPRMAAGPKGADFFLLCFSAPILIVALGQAFISRANANWAAPAYVAATALAVAWLVRARDKDIVRIGWLKAKMSSWLVAALGMHLISGAVTLSLVLVPGAIEVFGVENAFKDMRGWNRLAPRIAHLAAAGDYRVLMTDYRWTTAELLYYGRDIGLPVAMFDADGVPGNEYELNRPYRRDMGGPVLFVSYYADTSKVLARFSAVRPLEVFPMPRSLAPPPAPPAPAPWVRYQGKYDLPFYIFRLDGFRG